MGVRGLTYFIDSPEGSHLLKNHKLQNCKVIIDGNSILHYIYFKGSVSCQFGGDYDVFEREICRIFSAFRACGIEPYVVFDGAYTVDGKKSETTIRRARERIGDAASIVSGEEKTLIPCLALLTFKQTLDKLGVPQVTCDFEADSQLVVLANLWGCPVISDDSDFYIFQLTGGFVPLKHVNFNRSHVSVTSFLQVKLYRVENLLRSFPGMNRSVLPVLASVQGNDYVDPSLLSPFNTAVIRKYGKQNERQKILAILRWLGGKENTDRLVSEVVSHISRREQQRVRQNLTDSITRYKGPRSFESFNLAHVLEGSRDAASMETTAVKKSNGNTLPPWFATACRLAQIPASLLNVALTQSVVLPVQVEGTAPQAASTTSLPVRQVAYGLLLGNTAVLGRQRQGGTIVVEHTKRGTDLTASTVSPRSSLPSFGTLPPLTQIPSLDAEGRRAILLETLGVSAEFLGRFDEEIQLYMACLAYWLNHAKPSAGRHHLQAVILCAVLLCVLKEIEARRDGQAVAASYRSSVDSGQLSIRSTCRSADDALLSSVKQNARQYYENPLRINCWTSKPDQTAFSLSAQFQSCLLDALNLNCLLQCPVSTPQPADLFNGSLIYSVVHQLQLSRNPDSILHNMLMEGSTLAAVFDRLCSAVWATSGR